MINLKKIYLIFSSSYNLLNKKLKDIIKDNQNVTYNSLNDVSLNDILDDASYFGLFEEERIIVVKDTKYFGNNYKYEEDMEMLYSFISNMRDDMTLIFICDAINKNKDNTKKLISLGVKIENLDEEISKGDIYNFVVEYLSDKEYKLDKDTFNVIYNNCNNNLDIALMEIEKLSNIDKNITKEIVNEYGIKLNKIEDFAFGNAVIAKNFKVAFDELDKLLLENKSIPEIIGSLASRYIKIYALRDAMSRNLTDEEIVKALNYRNSGQVYYAKKDAKIYTMDELKEIIIKLVNLDVSSKSGVNPVYALKEFLISL